MPLPVAATKKTHHKTPTVQRIATHSHRQGRAFRFNLLPPTKINIRHNKTYALVQKHRRQKDLRCNPSRAPPSAHPHRLLLSPTDKAQHISPPAPPPARRPRTTHHSHTPPAHHSHPPPPIPSSTHTIHRSQSPAPNPPPTRPPPPNPPTARAPDPKPAVHPHPRAPPTPAHCLPAPPH
ncbi:MAG: hypothetical protein LBQ31_10195 [Bacteroidales bacterium]|nr:hypothetical protein [Bacteroidales bacterium]